MILDGTDDDGFRTDMAALFERAPRFIDRLVAGRPFESWEALFATAERIALEMPEEEQVELINAHPRLGAPPASVSDHSFREQGYDRDTTAAIAELARLNAEYEQRFGFRYCVFVAGRPRTALVPEMADALTRNRAAERDRALRDVIAIARDRATNGQVPA